MGGGEMKIHRELSTVRQILSDVRRQINLMHCR